MVHERELAIPRRTNLAMEPGNSTMVLKKNLTIENERVRRIAEILSEGVYAYLKQNGFLRDNPEQTDREGNFLEGTEKVQYRVEEMMN